MIHSASSNAKYCPDCGAENNPFADACWLCQRDLARESEIVEAELVTTHARNPLVERIFAVLTGLVAIVVVLVGIGVASEEPWLVLVYGILITPPLVGTFVRLKRQQQRQGHVGWGERLLTLIASFALMYAFLMVLGAAAMVAFFIYCVIALNR